MLPSSIYAIVCASTAHLNTSQCGAAEKFTGSKVIAVPSDPHTAKLTPDSIDAALYGFGDQHSSQPLVLTVSQSTEFGTVYSMDELRQLRTYCDAKKMLLHIGQSVLTEQRRAFR
jgi:threonine aldolase